MLASELIVLSLL